MPRTRCASFSKQPTVTSPCVQKYSTRDKTNKKFPTLTSTDVALNHAGSQPFAETRRRDVCVPWTIKDRDRCFSVWRNATLNRVPGHILSYGFEPEVPWSSRGNKDRYRHLLVVARTISSIPKGIYAPRYWSFNSHRSARTKLK